MLLAKSLPSIGVEGLRRLLRDGSLAVAIFLRSLLRKLLPTGQTARG